MTADRQALLRQLEGRLRNCWRGEPLADTRWKLTQTGMTPDDMSAFEDNVRQQLREERAPRRAA